jgi:hypothetical protein
MKTGRNILYNYFDIEQLPIGELPYTAIHRALGDEKYLRSFSPTYCRNDLAQGHLSALLYWYPNYIEQMYELAVDGFDYMAYFNRLPIEIIEGFKLLFPESIKKLEKARRLALDLNSLEEIKINRRKA